MANVVCIGSAPSSGSTLLADLLDAVPGMAATPELNIFCNRSSYDFSGELLDSIKNATAMPIRSRYMAACKFFNRKYVGAVGLSMSVLEKAVEESGSLSTFIETLAHHFAIYRDRPVDVLVEKTPSNINYAEDFCRTFPKGLFIFIIRDGRAVVASLKRRGYTTYEASLIWQMQVSYALRARGLSNYCEVRYEDLLRDPFDVSAKLASKVGIDVKPDKIEERFIDNQYRAELPRVSSWTVPTYTGGILPVPHYSEQLDDAEISWCQSSRLFGRHGGNIGQIASFAELLEQYDYLLDEREAPSLKLCKKIHAAYLVKSVNVLRQADLRVVFDRDNVWPIADQLVHLGFSPDAHQEVLPISDWDWTKELS